MIFSYTARETYDPTSNSEFSWTKYIEWSKLFQLKELVSLDSMLCSLVFQVDYGNETTYKYAVLDGSHATDLFNSLEYVLSNIQNNSKYNLLAVVKEPEQEYSAIELDEFEFIGYDLLDTEYIASALTNCGGFPETFSNSQLNEVGLLRSYESAKDIQSRLLNNNPNESHADCYIFALWRHKTIGKSG